MDAESWCLQPMGLQRDEYDWDSDTLTFCVVNAFYSTPAAWVNASLSLYQRFFDSAGICQSFLLRTKNSGQEMLLAASGGSFTPVWGRFKVAKFTLKPWLWEDQSWRTVLQNQSGRADWSTTCFSKMHWLRFAEKSPWWGRKDRQNQTALGFKSGFGQWTGPVKSWFPLA